MKPLRLKVIWYTNINLLHSVGGFKYGFCLYYYGNSRLRDVAVNPETELGFIQSHLTDRIISGLVFWSWSHLHSPSSTTTSPPPPSPSQPPLPPPPPPPTSVPDICCVLVMPILAFTHSKYTNKCAKINVIKTNIYSTLITRKRHKQSLFSVRAEMICKIKTKHKVTDLRVPESEGRISLNI